MLSFHLDLGFLSDLFLGGFPMTVLKVVTVAGL